MMIVIILVLWTWGLTPLWVNIVSTAVLCARVLWKTFSLLLRLYDAYGERDEEEGQEEVFKE